MTLHLGNCQLYGSIPPNIGTLKSLVNLHLSSNMLVGPIPSSITNLTNLQSLDLSSNKINGSMPLEIRNLGKLSYLDLSYNNLSGQIPSFLGLLSSLRSLWLDSNLFEGFIPSDIGKLKKLAELGLSNNKITGSIPLSLWSLNTLIYLDLSYNKLNGPIPTQICNLTNLTYLILANNNLLPSSPNVNRERNSKVVKHNLPIVILVPTLLFFVSTFVLVIFILFRRYRTKALKSDPSPTKNGDLFSIWNFDGKIAFEDIIKATEDFDIKYCIGTGGYDSVYRSILPSGKVVALKKLHRLEAEQPAYDTSFRNEIKFLTEIRQKNIVKLHGFCLHNRCMFLIYEYMKNGSLFYALSID
ncbi:hypothetical protein V6Z11_D09G025300 [Gossypium hirsutum]